MSNAKANGFSALVSADEEIGRNYPTKGRIIEVDTRDPDESRWVTVFPEPVDDGEPVLGEIAFQSLHFQAYPYQSAGTVYEFASVSPR